MSFADRSQQSAHVLLISIASVLTFLIGALTAFSTTASAAIVVGATCAVIGLFISIEFLILFQLVIATVLAGSVEYFGKISQAHWIPFLLGLFLAFKAFIASSTRQNSTVSTGNSSNSFAPFAVLYVSAVAFSSLVNLSPLGQVLVGLKNYFFIWGLLFAVGAASLPERLAYRFWLALVFIACLQLPVALYQKFFVASKLSNAGGAGGLSWDAVVGTFGGSEMGGHSGSMAMFIAMALAVAAMKWRDREWPVRRLLLVAALALPAVLLAEVKAFVIWLAIGFLGVFARQLRARPVEFIGAFLGAAAIVIALGLTYKSLYYDTGRDGTTYEDVYKKQIQYIFDPAKFNNETRDIGRVASVIFWWDQQRAENPVGILVGHGIGSSRSISTFGAGEAAARFAYKIDTSALTMLLWDFGLLGTFAFVGMIVAGALQAFRLSSSDALSTTQRQHLRFAGIALLLVLSGVAYTKDAVDDTSVQILLYFSLGSLAYYSRLRARAA